MADFIGHFYKFKSFREGRGNPARGPNVKIDYSRKEVKLGYRIFFIDLGSQPNEFRREGPFFNAWYLKDNQLVEEYSPEDVEIQTAIKAIFTLDFKEINSTP